MPETVDAAGRSATPLVVQLLRGLRVAQSIVVLVVLLVFCLANLLATLGDYVTPAIGLAWFAGMLAVALVDLGLVVANRFWGRLRWPAAAFVLAISIGATASLPAAELVRPAHWSLGMTGFLGVLLFCDTAFARLLGFVGVHVATMLVALLLAGRADGATLVEFALVVVSTEGLHLAVGTAANALREVAGEATTAAAARARIVTGQSVARRVHADREQRYAVLRGTALPLLRGMSDGSLGPADPEVRRRAALEAARLRRMFAVHGEPIGEPGADAGGPVAGELVGELETLVEMAERRGSTVRFASGALPADPPPAIRGALLDRVGGILLSATGSARVTVHCSDGEVVIGVVVDGVHGSPPEFPTDGRGAPDGDGASDGTDASDGIRTTVIRHDGKIWMEARWSQEPPPPR